MAAVRRRPAAGTAANALVTMLLAMVVFAGAIGCSIDRSAESCAEGEMGRPPNCFPEPPAAAAPGKRWHVAYSEEFEGADYDHEKLTPCFDWNYGHCTSTFNKGRETYKPEQVRVSDGSAKLVAEPLSPPEPKDACYQGVCTYKSGLISTARPNAENGQYLFPFTYGYIESRLKFPAVPGFFTAFWMWPISPDYKYRNEIDIVEILGGDPENLFMTYHYDDRNQEYRINRGRGDYEDNGVCPVRDYAQDWVRFGLDWQPDHIAWYMNGVKCGEFTNPTKIENSPMQFIMSLMVDNEWERNARSTGVDPVATAELEVDYIRIYQQI